MLSVDCHFLKPSVPGAFTTTVEVLKRGNRVASAMVTMRQEGRGEVARALATCGSLATATSVGPNLRCLTRRGSRPPLLPPIERCLRLPLGTADPLAAPNSVRTRVILMTSEGHFNYFKGSFLCL